MRNLKALKAYLIIGLFIIPNFNIFAKDFNIEIACDIGYREDKIKLTAWNEEINSYGEEKVQYFERYKKLRSPNFSLAAQMEYYNFIVIAHGDYAFFQNGKFESVIFARLSPDIPLPMEFHSDKIKGSFSDVDVALGYNIILIKKGRKFIIIPQCGYYYSHQWIKRRKILPVPFWAYDLPIGPPGISNSIAFINGSSKLKRNWYGPFVGGGILIEFLKKINFEIDYFYHFLRMKHKTDLFLNLVLTIPLIPLVATNITHNIQDFKMKAYGNEIKSKISYFICPSWGLGISGRCFFYRTYKRRVPFIDKTTDTSVSFPTTYSETIDYLNYKTKWNEFDINFESTWRF